MQEARDMIFSHQKIEREMYSSLLTVTENLKSSVGLKAQSFTITYSLVTTVRYI